MIFYILEATNILMIKDFLLTEDIENTFDSVNHLFIFYVLDKFSFGRNFIKWITNQESCIINGVKTTKYPKLRNMTIRFYIF